MQTDLKELSPVERALEIHAPAEAVDPEMKRALRTQRSQVNMKGFRKGKAPLSLLKKMYGEALKMQVAETFVQEAFEKEIMEADALDVLGQPQMTELDYEIDGDLRAVVTFSVRPEVEIKDLSGEELPKLKHDVTDEDVDESVERLRLREADLRPTDEGATEESFVRFDLQEVDAESGTPIIGQKDEDQSFFLDSPQIEQNPMLQELRSALLGAKAGDTVRFTFAHDEAHGEYPAGEAHAHHFEATVHDIKARELPELDDAFVEDVTEGEVETVEAFRAEARERIQQSWDDRAQELLQGQIVERMLELHPLPIPPQVEEMFLDSFVEDVKQRNEGELPEGFDETHFRNQNRQEAHQQAHWMLIRDQVVEDEALEVAEEDTQAFFEKQAAREGGQFGAEQLRQFYQSMPQLMGQVEQQIISQKVFDTLAERFHVVEKDRETFEREAEEAQATTAGGPANRVEPAAEAPSPIIGGE